MAQNDDRTLPGISVVVITKNEEKNIRVCLNSLMKQDYPVDRWECIVIDSSIDKTPEIVKEYDSVRLLQSEAGYSRQRNEGLKAARFDIVAFVDADTVIPDCWLRGIATGFREYPDAAGIAGDAFPPPGSGWLDRCIAAVGHPAGGAIGLDANTPVGIDGISFIPGCNGAFYKSALEDIGGYNKEFDSGGEDIDLSRRLHQAGYRLHYGPEMKIYHKPHGPLIKYAKWNIGVGVTKYSLNKMGPILMMVEPGSILWVIFGFALLVPGFIVEPLLAMGSLIGVHFALQLVLRIWSRPYRFLLQRQHQVGLGRLSIWVVVPILVYIRQLFMNIGMWKQWRRQRRMK
ncbi:MAG: glycosyltransferase [Acidobacteria bacterium]|nr:glycosyltransferase [Acidobacteriota bacterium]